MKKNKGLRRSQLDRQFGQLSGLNLTRPKRGWIKEIREALGMSMQDLGSRLGVIKQRVERIEKDELDDKVTIETIKKTAAAMDCEFVYFLIPKHSLESTLKKQALKAAEAISKQVGTTMELESQGTSSKARRDLIERLAQEMLMKEDRKIWRTK